MRRARDRGQPRGIWPQDLRMADLWDGSVLRTSKPDTSGQVWVYVANRHKTEPHVKERRTYLGPTARASL